MAQKARKKALLEIEIQPLYAGAESHSWRILDSAGGELLRDIAPTEQVARERALAAQSSFQPNSPERRVVLHQGLVVKRRHGTLTTTLCGRMNSRNADGMNIAETPQQVTCKHCLAAMRRGSEEISA